MRIRVLLPIFILTVSCGASVDPAMKARVDAQLASLQPQSTLYAAPRSDMPPPLAPGQWIRLKSVDSDGQPSFLTSKVIERVGSAFWIEDVLESYKGRTVIKILVDLGDRTDPENIDIQGLVVKVRNNAPIDYSQGPMLAIVKGSYKAMVKSLVVRWHGLPQETRTTTAGTFTDCFKGRSDVAFGPIHEGGIAWFHPAVPINGAVAFHGDGGNIQELVGFGLSGAVSEL